MILCRVNMSSGQFRDQGSHGQFDLELDHICHWVELHIDQLVFERHEADKENLRDGGDVSLVREGFAKLNKQRSKKKKKSRPYIHGYRNDHQITVEANQGGIFDQAMVSYKPLSNDAEEPKV